MKNYVRKSLDKLNQLAINYPNAQLKFGRNTITYCNILESDIYYDEETNIIFIGK